MTQRRAHLVVEDGPYALWSVQVIAEVGQTLATAVAPWAGEDRVRPCVARAWVDVGLPGYDVVVAGLGGGTDALVAVVAWLRTAAGAARLGESSHVADCPRHRWPMVAAPLCCQATAGRIALVCPRVGCKMGFIADSRRTLKRWKPEH